LKRLRKGWMEAVLEVTMHEGEKMMAVGWKKVKTHEVAKMMVGVW
jgi:hypothetical protein